MTICFSMNENVLNSISVFFFSTAVDKECHFVRKPTAKFIHLSAHYKKLLVEIDALVFN